MKQVAGTIKLDLAQFRELEAFAQFGSDLDTATQKLLDKGRKLTELLKQGQYKPLNLEEQVASIYVGVKGYLDGVDTNEVVRFEREFIQRLKSASPEILDSIKNERKITAENEPKLQVAIKEFLEIFLKN